MTRLAFVACTEPALEERKPAPKYDYGEQGDSSLGQDAIIHRAEAFVRLPTQKWASAVSDLQGLIEAEQLSDVSTPYYRSPTRTAPDGLTLRETDGALLRRTGGRPLAIHGHAWRQLVALLAHGQHERGMAASFAWLNPPLRAQVFAELRDRSIRREGPDSPILLRSHLDAATGLPALRAVLSGVYSGTHFDDLAILRALEGRVDATAPGGATRGLTETHGWATLTDGTEEIAATVRFGNSEVGASALKFSAGCHIRVVDAHLQAAPKLVDVTDSTGASARRHTLARKGVTEEMRAEMAQRRIASSIESASWAARQLAESWTKARASFAPGWSGERGAMAPAEAAAVVLDVLDERAPRKMALRAGDRAPLQAVLVSEERLKLLPFCSAAHIAAAFACLGREATDAEDCRRLLELAAEWVARRWESLR